MKIRLFLLNAISALSVSLIAISAQAANEALPYSVEHTEYGHPDLQGNWKAASLTLLERPELFQTLNITDEQAAQFGAGFLARLPELLDPNFDLTGAAAMTTVNGVARSSIITQPENGLMPYSPKGLELAEWESQREELYDHPEQRPRWERCLGGLGSPPIRMFFDVIPHKIVQNKDHVLIYTEDQGSARIIYLEDESAHSPPPSWVGHSVGTWEGNSLVVETSNFESVEPARANIGRPVLIGENSTVKERFTRQSETKILYEFVVEDSDYYTESWAGEFELDMIDGEIYEFACHEGNYSLPGILRGGQINN